VQGGWGRGEMTDLDSGVCKAKPLHPGEAISLSVSQAGSLYLQFLPSVTPLACEAQRMTSPELC
jgi:hypothetical protein